MPDKPYSPKYQFKPEKISECVEQALRHTYAACLLRHTDGYLAGVGVAVIALEEINKVFFLLSMAELRVGDKEISKIQRYSTDHHAKLANHVSFLENCLYISSVGAVLNNSPDNIDEQVNAYISHIREMTSEVGGSISHPIFDEIKQRCFYIDISHTPYKDCGKKYMSTESACFYISYVESAVKMCSSAWEIFKPAFMEHVDNIRKYHEGRLPEKSLVRHSLVLMHATNNFSLYPSTFSSAARNYDMMVNSYGWPLPPHTRESYEELLNKGYTTDAERHVKTFREARDNLLKISR